MIRIEVGNVSEGEKSESKEEEKDNKQGEDFFFHGAVLVNIRFHFIGRVRHFASNCFSVDFQEGNFAATLFICILTRLTTNNNL